MAQDQAAIDWQNKLAAAKNPQAQGWPYNQTPNPGDTSHTLYGGQASPTSFNVNAAQPPPPQAPNDPLAAMNQYMPTYTNPMNLPNMKIIPKSADVQGAAIVNPDTTALNAMQTNALSTDSSPWAKMALEQNNLNKVQGLNTAASTGAGTTNTAMSNLAMNGGLSGGASERAAEGGARNANAAMQGVNANAASNATGIGMQDTANKMNMLSQIPGMQLANSQFKAGQNQFNVGQANQNAEFNAAQENQIQGQNIANTFAGTAGQNQFNINKYGQQMAALGSNANSNAIANSGGGSPGLIGQILQPFTGR